MSPLPVLPLPPSPQIDVYKKQAKALVKACTSPSPRAIAQWAEDLLNAIALAHGDAAVEYSRASIPEVSRELVRLAEDLLLRQKAPKRRCALSDAQLVIARAHGFESWPKFSTEVEALAAAVRDDEVAALKIAIDRNDLDRVVELMTRTPALHRAPLGYGGDGPLTWAAECRGIAPSRERLSIAEWMLEHGSDVHQGFDGPLMRATLDDRIPMMELLVAHGADVNAEWHGEYPVIFGACESVQPACLKWLLDHGANPNCDRPGRAHRGTALDYLIGAYERSARLPACIDILIKAGGTTKYDVPVVLELLRGRLDRVSERVSGDSALVQKQFPGLDFGTTGGRTLTLDGATLLHVAAEYQNVEAAALLLDSGADVNAPALVRADGVGGQTPIFHAATQMADQGLPMTELLVARGADLSVRAKLPGHYERPGEVVECSPVEYAKLFEDVPWKGDKAKTVAFLSSRAGL